MASIQNMSLEDLQLFIDKRIDERLTQLLGKFELPDDLDEADSHSWDELRASVERHRWTPPAGAKSSLEYLREDRDS